MLARTITAALQRAARTKVLVSFINAEGAGLHCQPMGRSLLEQRMYDWLDERSSGSGQTAPRRTLGAQLTTTPEHHRASERQTADRWSSPKPSRRSSRTSADPPIISSKRSDSLRSARRGPGSAAPAVTVWVVRRAG